MSKHRGVKRRLSKTDILSKVTQADIYSFYLSKFNHEFTVKTIEYLAETGYKVSNPMRLDRNPSMGFRYVGKGKLKIRDFAGYIWGDCFDLVAYIINVNPNDKLGFIKVLKKIAYDLNIYTIPISEVEADEFKVDIDIKKVRNSPYIIEPVIRDWNIFDMEYWNNRGISLRTLKAFHVYPVLSYSAMGATGFTVRYTYTSDNPCYAYDGGLRSDGTHAWDLYFPKHREGMPKFIKSHNSLGGLLTYNQKADILIIIKSLKDAMSIYEILSIYYSKYSVAFIVPMSESTPISKKHLDFLINNHSRTFVLYDFDRVGIINSNKIKRAYPITQLFFTNGRFNSHDYGHKDYSDYYFKRGKRNALEIIKEVINEYEREQDSVED